MAKKIIITSDNALVSAAIYGIINEAFTAYFRKSKDNNKQLYCDGYDAESVCIPAVEAVINSVVSPKVYSIVVEEVDDSSQEEE